jgi:hypothetical protein
LPEATSASATNSSRPEVCFGPGKHNTSIRKEKWGRQKCREYVLEGVKVKFNLQQARKVQWGSKGVALLFL